MSWNWKEVCRVTLSTDICCKLSKKLRSILRNPVSFEIQHLVISVTTSESASSLRALWHSPRREEIPICRKFLPWHFSIFSLISSKKGSVKNARMCPCLELLVIQKILVQHPEVAVWKNTCKWEAIFYNLSKDPTNWRHKLSVGGVSSQEGRKVNTQRPTNKNFIFFSDKTKKRF